MSKHVPIKVIQGPYQGLSRLSSTVTLIPPWGMKSFYSLSLSLPFPLGLTDDCISGPLTIVRFKCSFPIGYTLLLARDPSLVRL